MSVAVNTRTVVWLGVAAPWLAAVAVGGGPEAVSSGGIGFRGDGTGVFPEDCKPPVEFDAVKGVNLVWRAPLPNHSNSSPIVVGRKVFVTCAAGWPEGQDCAQILCFDVDTGRLQWKRDLDEFATMPEAQAKEAREIRKEYHRRIRRLNNIMWEYQSADETKKESLLKEAAALGVAKKSAFEKYNWGIKSAEQGVYGDKTFGEKLKDVCGYSPITWSPTCLDVNMPTPVSDGRRVFVYTGRRTVHAFDLEGNPLWQVWQSDAPYNYHWPEDCANAPAIVDGKLIMYVFDHCWAYDLDTGKRLWKVQSGVIRHGMGTPVVLRLPVLDSGGKTPSTGSGQTETMVFLWTGDLVRVRDGKKMVVEATKVMFGGMASDGGQMVYAMTYGKDAVEARGIKDGQLKFELPAKAGSTALRFSMTGPDAVAVEQVWTVPEKLGSYPILWKDRLHTVAGGTLDAKTGRVLSAGKKGQNIGENGFILAGGHFYGQPGTAPGWPRANKDNPDAMEVINVKPVADGSAMESMPLAPMPGKITDPELLKKVVAMTGLAYYKSSYGWHPPSASPFASGNRLFVRTFDHLYCFGDQSQPFVPSREFAGVPK